MITIYVLIVLILLVIVLIIGLVHDYKIHKDCKYLDHYLHNNTVRIISLILSVIAVVLQITTI